MLSALLQGRANFSFSEIRVRNHMSLYTHVLGLVDLLQPQIFQLQYSAPFESLLHAYFDLLLVCYECNVYICYCRYICANMFCVQ